ncbi:MAG TPA: type II toxin-antitoxin system Phd/YefM family antitoxin [Gemmatimonadales bacterium]|jgi:prevent-host-death family protein
MKSESISRAKNHLSALIKRVQAGEPVLITDRGVPVARLMPVQLGSGIPPRVLGLAQQGLARLPEETPVAEWLDLPWPEVAHGRSAVDLLLEERRSTR